MFLYEKKVIYLSRYQNGVREAPAGFVKLLREKSAYVLDIHIRPDIKLQERNYTLSLVMGNREIEWETLSAMGGSFAMQRRIELQGERICIFQEEFEEEDWQGIVLHIDGQRRIAGYFREPESVSVAKSASEEEIGLCAADETSQHKLYIQKDHIPQKDNRSDEKMQVEEPISEDKWEQLQKSYQKVHPFGDERLFLSIEPKDFVILQAPFQKLVNNSFLLHGFYNYRHLILGPDKDIGGGERSRFYLGVPGTYFEREKMVAIMFGFEGFECDGAVEIGKFGYYMRRVEL